MLNMLLLGLFYNGMKFSLLIMGQNGGHESRFYVTITNHIPSKKFCNLFKPGRNGVILIG